MLGRKLVRSLGNIRDRHNKIVILGGGAGGITLAGKLTSGSTKILEPAQVSIIDGSTLHHYKPGWTLYAAEEIPRRMIQTDLKSVIPTGANFVNQYVERIEPDKNTIVLKDGSKHTYDHLVITTGIQFNWEKVKGLKEALADPNRDVCSVYDWHSHEKMRALRHKKYEHTVFTQPASPITCGGAPQKVVYLTQEAWKKHGWKPEIKFIQGTPSLFAVPFYAEKLETLIKEKGIINLRNLDLIEVTPSNKAVFRHTQTKELHEHAFDYLHAVPPMSGKDYVKGSGLADDSNYVIVDKNNFRNPKYPNVWAIGDGAALPTSRTMSAVIEQAHILECNLREVLKGGKPTHNYDGYTACPILVGDRKVLLAEFKYDNVICGSFARDQRTPSRFAFFLKKYVFPFAALNLMKNNIWKGRRTLWNPPQEDHSAFQKEAEAKAREERLKKESETKK